MKDNQSNDNQMKGNWMKNNWMKRAGLVLIVFVLAALPVLMGSGWTENISGTKLRPSAQPGATSKDYAQLKAQLNEYLSTQPGYFGVYFKNLDSGETFAINGDEPITAASTIKAPAVLYLNTLISQGKLSWDDRLTYNSQLDYQGGSGILHSYSVNQFITTTVL